MKKLLAIILIVVLTASMAGCTKLAEILEVINETDAPAGDPTPAPADTSAPSTFAPSTDAPEITPEPTDEPDMTDEPSSGTFLRMLENGVPLEVDLDEDGLPDTVLFTGHTIDEYGDLAYELTITLGAKPDAPYKYSVDYCFECNACVIDCYPNDGRKEVLLSYGAASDDWETVAFRVIDNSTSIDDFPEYFGVTRDEMLGFTAEDGFETGSYTDVLGTRLVHARMKITSRGYFMVSHDYSYVLNDEAAEDDDYWTILLTAPLDGTIMHEDGVWGANITIPAGTRIRPYRTNLDTYVDVLLPDGTVVRVNMQIHPWTGDGSEWGVFLNGRNQDEYAEIFYAD